MDGAASRLNEVYDELRSAGFGVPMSELQSPSDVADLVTLIDNWLNEFAEAGEHVLAIDRGTSDETSFGNLAGTCGSRENQKKL